MGQAFIYWPSYLTLVCAVVTASAPLVARGQPYWVGLDFIDSPTTSPPPFLTDFEPFPLTASTNNFVTQGALAGWTEDAAQRAIALAVEDVFRSIDVGDPSSTIRLGVTQGAVPDEFAGQRLNIAMAKPTNTTTALGVTPRPGDYNDSQASGTIVAAVFLDSVDALGSSTVTYAAADGAINAITGTAAHEIGHVFGAAHVSTFVGDPQPLPIMATGSTGLLDVHRLSERRFSDTLPSGSTNVDLLVSNIGTTLRGDFNFDLRVDSEDLDVLVANWGLTDRLAVEGDANGDHQIDGADAAHLIVNWTDAAPPAAALASAFASAGGVPMSLAAVVQAPEPGGPLIACCLAACLAANGRRSRRDARVQTVDRADEKQAFSSTRKRLWNERLFVFSRVSC